MSEYEFYVAVSAGFLIWTRYCYLEAVHLTRPRAQIDPHADAHGDVPRRPSHD
jgi:hypothetical protein